MGTDHKMNSKKEDEGFWKSRHCLVQLQAKRILHFGWDQLNKYILFRLDCEELKILEIKTFLGVLGSTFQLFLEM